MERKQPKVIVIPAKTEIAKEQAVKRQLRVAAYCRVSTEEDEQLSSYEAQKTYFTDKIMGNKEWTLVDIFADEGITGTSAKKRPEFLRMIKYCKQGKVDIVLAKSISRFARNTVDCLTYVRLLKSMGIAVIFEKENINTMQVSSEVFVAMYGAFAQSESESISGNVTWGKRQAMREGKAIIQYTRLYGYRRGEDGTPEIIPEEAEVVRQIYKTFLAGASLEAITQKLIEDGISARGKGWYKTTVRGILTNEKYCGDVLLQKTFSEDCISKKVVKNEGQLPMYLIQNHHDAIIERELFDAVREEFARRNAGRSPSKKQAPTGKGKYSSKLALSDRLICGECGTLYRRCTWNYKGSYKVWRCTSRLDFGKKYCHNSPTLKEKPLQNAILSALNKAMSDRNRLIDEITQSLEVEFAPRLGEELSIGDIDTRLEGISRETMAIVTEAAARGEQTESESTRLKALVKETTDLKQKREELLSKGSTGNEVARRVENAVAIMKESTSELQEWDDSIIRQLVDTVKVLSPTRIEVIIRGGISIVQDIKDE